jgi:2-oxoacid:acceptor oxidoreductase gamma subunit (pyruvate/2-ketoisovalerate family)
MQEIRLHGRGGQGAVMASEILASAFVKEGKYSTAIPMYGFERRGAAVSAFVRMDDKPIWDRDRIYYPNCVMVMDSVLQDLPSKLEGLRPEGILVQNTSKPLQQCPHENASIVGVVNG